MECDQGHYLAYLSDEMDSTPHCAAPNHFRCLNGRYITAGWLCDNYKDCQNHEDDDPENCGTKIILCRSDPAEKSKVLT